MSVWYLVAKFSSLFISVYQIAALTLSILKRMQLYIGTIIMYCFGWSLSIVHAGDTRGFQWRDHTSASQKEVQFKLLRLILPRELLGLRKRSVQNCLFVTLPFYIFVWFKMWLYETCLALFLLCLIYGYKLTRPLRNCVHVCLACVSKLAIRILDDLGLLGWHWCFLRLNESFTHDKSWAIDNVLTGL